MIRYLIEPEVVRLQQCLEFREELVIVEGIDGLHITSAVVQVPCDLSKMNPPKDRYTNLLNSHQCTTLLMFWLTLKPSIVLCLFPNNINVPLRTVISDGPNRRKCPTYLTETPVARAPGDRRMQDARQERTEDRQASHRHYYLSSETDECTRPPQSMHKTLCKSPKTRNHSEPGAPTCKCSLQLLPDIASLKRHLEEGYVTNHHATLGNLFVVFPCKFSKK